MRLYTYGRAFLYLITIPPIGGISNTHALTYLISITVISLLVPIRMGGPKVPEPQEV